ncbi:GNAT family N-acetyltransferase [Halococcus hamelinensis]|uniref:Protein N-acetyltransferase-like protein n=1 Tax=Halococcus hamelinensis 100A6 TaxID=1132509 RepID=M0LSU5_9EURY|nr:GNAT family protein [Halococcus hamelinensis]EMA36491.1 protein N-acetyltransferase-like protein [Halococcus hamelinensis 100A6]
MPGARVEAGERVTLRTIERDDSAFVQRGHANPAIRYPLGVVGHENEHQVEEGFEEFIESDDHANFLVCLDDEEAGPGHPAEDETTPIGVVNATHVDWDRPMLAYWLTPEHHGEGYGTEAVALAVESLFRTYDIHSIAAHAFDYNAASRGVLESLGFTQEGRGREARFVDGEYRDTLMYGLLRREWRANEKE